jgi:hypothetical protein
MDLTLSPTQVYCRLVQFTRVFHKHRDINKSLEHFARVLIFLSKLSTDIAGVSKVADRFYYKCYESRKYGIKDYLDARNALKEILSQHFRTRNKNNNYDAVAKQIMMPSQTSVSIVAVLKVLASLLGGITTETSSTHNKNSTAMIKKNKGKGQKKEKRVLFSSKNRAIDFDKTLPASAARRQEEYVQPSKAYLLNNPRNIF